MDFTSSYERRVLDPPLLLQVKLSSTRVSKRRVLKPPFVRHAGTRYWSCAGNRGRARLAKLGREDTQDAARR
jgi:hypothetical protein